MIVRHIQIRRDLDTGYGEVEVVDGVILTTDGFVLLASQFVIAEGHAVDYETSSGIRVLRQAGNEMPLCLIDDRSKGSLRFVYRQCEWYQVGLVCLGVSPTPTPAQQLEAALGRAAPSLFAIVEIVFLVLLFFGVLYVITLS